jgi:hypothetical protein
MFLGLLVEPQVTIQAAYITGTCLTVARGSEDTRRKTVTGVCNTSANMVRSLGKKRLQTDGQSALSRMLTPGDDLTFPKIVEIRSLTARPDHCVAATVHADGTYMSLHITAGDDVTAAVRGGTWQRHGTARRHTDRSSPMKPKVHYCVHKSNHRRLS